MDILKNQVIKMLPEFAETLIREREIVFRIVNESSDEFFIFDIEEKMRDESVFRIVEEPEPGAFTLTLKNLKFIEREVPERSQIIRYGYYEVDTVKAVLLMPNNASFVFNEVAGGFRLNIQAR